MAFVEEAGTDRDGHPRAIFDIKQYEKTPSIRKYIRSTQRLLYGQYSHTGAQRQYASQLLSSAGKKDGLYWNKGDRQPTNPVSSTVATASDEGYTVERRNAEIPTTAITLCF